MRFFKIERRRYTKVFWIEVRGSEVVKGTGRTDKGGTEDALRFSTPAEAARALDGLVARYIRKGYVEYTPAAEPDTPTDAPEQREPTSDHGPVEPGPATEPQSPDLREPAPGPHRRKRGSDVEQRVPPPSAEQTTPTEPPAATTPSAPSEPSQDAAAHDPTPQAEDFSSTPIEPSRSAGRRELPAVLVDPPWHHVEPDRGPTVITGLSVPQELHLEWKPGEREQWLAADTDSDAAIQAALDAQHPDPAEVAAELAWGPGGWAGPMFDKLIPETRALDQFYLRYTMATYGDRAIKPVIGWSGKDRYLRRDADVLPGYASLLLPVSGPAVATVMVRFANSRESELPDVERWFARHPEDAALGLIPLALAKPGPRRTTAEDFLVRVAVDNGTDTVLEAAEHYGHNVADAVSELLAERFDSSERATDRDAVAPVSATVREFRDWLDPAALPPLPARPDGGTAIPTTSLPDVVKALSLSTLDDPYPGLDELIETVDPPAFAAFARTLFDAWGEHGYPWPERWVLDAQGLVGDDETVALLAPLIRKWPRESAHKRSDLGLRVLGAIGSEASLVQLQRIALKSRYKVQKQRAHEFAAQVARERGLTPDELADGLVPDLDLPKVGTKVLDYGRRQFEVHLTAELTPYVTEDGVRRKTLPKPGVKDDAERADPAYAWYKDFKKELRGLAADQLTRLERAMVSQRSWDTDVFRELFLEHPVMVQLARRLVWTVDDPGFPTTSDPHLGPHVPRLDEGGAFRVLEDNTLVDPDGRPYSLTDRASIRLAHPLRLPPVFLRDFRTAFADDGIRQPFEQLARGTFSLDEEARSFGVVLGIEGKTVATPKILGLESRGWYRIAAEDNGIQFGVSRALPDGTVLYIGLDPGVTAGDPGWAGYEEQTLTAAIATTAPRARPLPPVSKGSLADLNPILASEILRDIDWLIAE